jgi:hypothetical protein
MSNLTPILAVRQPSEETIAWIVKQLLICGFQVERTFDLRTARMPHEDYSCPKHGGKDCTCQMVVLVVHEDVHLATLVAHGQDDRTFLSLVQGENQVMYRRVVQALLPAIGEVGA